MRGAAMSRDLNFDTTSEEAREAARTARALITARLSDLADNDGQQEFSSAQMAEVTGAIMRDDDPERATALLLLAMTRHAASTIWQLAGCLEIEPDEAMRQLAVLWEKHDVTL